MNPDTLPLRNIDHHFSLVAANIAALEQSPTQALPDTAAGQVLVLAETALEIGLVDKLYETLLAWLERPDKRPGSLQRNGP